jgi:hypothetical protein
MLEDDSLSAAVVVLSGSVSSLLEAVVALSSEALSSDGLLSASVAASLSSEALSSVVSLPAVVVLELGDSEVEAVSGESVVEPAVPVWAVAVLVEEVVEASGVGHSAASGSVVPEGDSEPPAGSSVGAPVGAVGAVGTCALACPTSPGTMAKAAKRPITSRVTLTFSIFMDTKSPFV